LLMAQLCAPTSMQPVQKGGQETEALGRSVGGLGTKVHVKALMFW
jgi:hypothetical protein